MGFVRVLAAKTRLREVDRLLKEGYTFVVDADLEELLRHDCACAAYGARKGAGERWPGA